MARDDLVIATEQTAYKIFPSMSHPGKWRVFRMARVGNGWTTTEGGPPETRLVFDSERAARDAAERLAHECTMEHVKARASLVPYRADETEADYYKRVALADFDSE